MPLSELFHSLRCTNLFKRSKVKQPMISNHKDHTVSDTTESDTEEAPATAQHKDSQPLSTMDSEHTVTLSLLDQGMPRHYTRFCLGFRLGETPASEAISRLQVFFQRTFRAQPWLAGYACPVKGNSKPADKLEIRFSQRDVENFQVKVRELSEDKFSLTYDELCKLGMPPSKIPRDLVSSCPDRRPDTERALVLDVTVNVISGGLLIAIFLHHGVTDGASMGTIISGQLCRDISEISPLTPEILAAKAEAETQTRLPLFRIPPNQALGSHLEYKPFLRTLNQAPLPPLGPTPSPSEVTSHIFHFSDSTLQHLKANLNSLLQSSSPTPEIPWITTHDALQSLLWQHLTRARIPSLTTSHKWRMPENSTLLIPVNIRKRIAPPLPRTYLGGAVALTVATVPLSFLRAPPPPPPLDTNDPTRGPLANPSSNSNSNSNANAYLLPTAILIHTTIARCTDTYLREVLALTTGQESVRNMVDLNVDTASGLDLCITSWAVLPVFDFESDSGMDEDADCLMQETVGGDQCAKGAKRRGVGDDLKATATGTLGMGLGLPDFVRKPWSRDAGGCIILPRDRRRRTGSAGGSGSNGRGCGGGADSGEAGLEVLVQLKTEDMQRLRNDRVFMGYVGRVVD